MASHSNPKPPEIRGLFHGIIIDMKRENDAYYTDDELVELIGQFFPNFKNQKSLRILEPSVGTGQFLPKILKKYSRRNIVVDALDIDEKVLDNTKEFYDNFSSAHVKFNFIHDNFLTHNFRRKYDFLICNPPFSFAQDFVEKCLTLADKIIIILPKNFLSSEKFRRTREFIEQVRIEKILDLRECGFKDVKIETICLILDTTKKPSTKQKYFTDSKFPYWLIYRDKEFDETFKKLKLGIFNVYRDRDLKNEVLSNEKTDEKNIWVLRSRNVTKDGLKHIAGYDQYVSKKDLEGTKAMRFLNRDDVFIAPNLSSNIRVIRKPKNVACNGSVAMLVQKPGVEIVDEDLEFFSSKEFQKFYDIATNKSTRSKNIDKNSVYFFGVLKHER